MISNDRSNQIDDTFLNLTKNDTDKNQNFNLNSNVDMLQISLKDRLLILSDHLLCLAKMLAEQAEFYSDDQMILEVSFLHQTITHAKKKINRIEIAGNRWKREIEKTMLFDLAKAIWTTQQVINRANDNIWPDLLTAQTQAKNQLKKSFQLDSSFFTVDNFDFNKYNQLIPASFNTLPQWKILTDGYYIRVLEPNIQLSVMQWGSEERWIGQVGGINTGFYPSAQIAASDVEKAYKVIFE